VDGKLKYYLGQITPEEQKRVSAALLAATQPPQAEPAGMPRTGSPLMIPLIAAFGLALLAAGTALRKRTR
jgi:MYXO-CTERM domain-containing protein